MSIQSVVKGKRNQLKAHGVGPAQAPQSLVSEALGVSSPGAKCQPEGKLGSLTQLRLEIHLNSKNYRCPRVWPPTFTNSSVPPPSTPPHPFHVPGIGLGDESEVRTRDTARPPTLLARQHFSFWGLLFPHLPTASLDILSFSDVRCVITISKKRACSLRQG